MTPDRLVIPSEILSELKVPTFDADLEARFLAADSNYRLTASTLEAALITQSKAAQIRIDHWHELHLAGGLAHDDYLKRYNFEVEPLARTSRGALQVLNDQRQAIKSVVFGANVPGRAPLDVLLTLGLAQRFSPLRTSAIRPDRCRSAAETLENPGDDRRKVLARRTFTVWSRLGSDRCRGCAKSQLRQRQPMTGG